MADENLYLGPTVLDRFVAATSRDDENEAQRLAQLAPGPEDLDIQRAEAWSLLSAGNGWAARALDSVGISDTNDRPVHDPEAAFERAQHLDQQLWKLNQESGSHDAVALLVERVKQACYLGAELGPVVGGLISSFRQSGSEPAVSATREPDPKDLQAIGSELGEALRRLGELELADPIKEAEQLPLRATA
jgi:hypothetical protein